MILAATEQANLVKCHHMYLAEMLGKDYPDCQSQGFIRM